MAIREGDALPYLRLKQKMVESDCEAVFSDGCVLPVLIFKTGGQSKFAVDTDDAFYEAAALPGFVRFTKKPVAAPILAPVQLVDNWVAKDDPVAGSESVLIAERWNPAQLYRRNLERESFGVLTVEKCIGRNPQTNLKYYRCKCKCGRKDCYLVASQADLLMQRVTGCQDKKSIPFGITNESPKLKAGLF